MPPNNPRWPAAIGAIVCAVFTLYALFRDVRSVADIGASQAGILVAVSVAIIAGFYAKQSRSRADRAIMWFLFVACTCIAVGLGSGRTSAMMEENTSKATHTKDAHTARKLRLDELDARRKELHTKIAPAEKSFADAQKEQKLQCGRKNNDDRCEASTKAMDTADKALKRAQDDHRAADDAHGKLSDQVIDARPAPRPNADLNSITQVVSLFTSTRAVAHEWVITLWPFVLAIVAELGLIAMSHKAFEPREAKPIVIAPTTIRPKRDDPRATVTTRQLADQLNMRPKLLRKYLTQKLDIEKPGNSWVFTPEEARTIQQRIELLRASQNIAN